MADLVIGAEAGPTHTRALVAGLDGTVLARSDAPASGGADPRRRVSGALTVALTAALGGRDPAAVRAGVIAVARVGAADDPVVRAAADMAWWSLGLTGRPRLVSDLAAVFASGTPEPDGLLLLAGFGAAAAALQGRQLVRRCDGYDWPLGGQGSATWIGLHGVHAALDAQDGRGPATRLRADLATHLGLAPDEELAEALRGRPPAGPAQLAALAPLVTRAAVAGDAVACELVEAAAGRLFAGLRAVADGPPTGELVLAGRLLAGGPVRAAVERRLAGAAVHLRAATSPAAGAAVLAIAAVSGTVPAELHATLIGAAS